MSMLSFAYGTKKIDFSLKRKAVRSMAITVQADGNVRVVAPLHATDLQVIVRVKKRSRWIAKQWERQAGYLPEPKTRSPHSGSSLRYLGRQYRIRVHTRSAESMSVCLHRSVLEVYAKDRKDPAEIQRLIKSWFRKRAAIVLQSRFEHCLVQASAYRLPIPQMRLRAMQKRWGSCVRKDLILLNPELVHASSACIDYVIIHEICHLKHPDHGKRFRDLLTRLLPDWQNLKHRLESMDL